MNFTRSLLEKMQLHPGKKVAIHDDSGAVTYNDMLQGVTDSYGKLIQQGIWPGQRVIILMSDSSTWANFFLALSAAGAVIILLNPKLPIAVRTDMIAKSQCDAILYDNTELPTDEFANFAVRLYDVATMLSAPNTQLAYHEYSDTEQGLWCSSSGSTGRGIKYVVHPHANLFAVLDIESLVSCITPDSVTFVTSKLTFQYGLTKLLNSLWVGGSVVITAQLPSRNLVYGNIKTHKVTHFFTTPTVLYNLLKQHAPSDAMATVTAAWVGGEVLNKQAEEKFKEMFGLPIYNIYGTAEILSFAIVQGHDHYKEFTLGKPLATIDIRYEPIESTSGDLVEMYIKSPCMAIGYFDDPVATEASFKDGWFRTRDIVQVDSDGFVHYVCRAGDYVKVKSSFVSMIEVEEQLDAMNNVDECVVIPYTIPSGGIELRAYIVPADGVTITPGQVRKFLSPRLESHKVPKQIVFVDNIPKTVTTKKIRNVSAFPAVQM